ncbi:MAG: GAP family protein [Candidatus Aenigmatarchaeota archaeon]
MIEKIIGLAIADSINPCEMGILLLMLIAVSRTYKNKRAILVFGLAFILTMFLGYFLIGYLLVEVFSKFSEFFKLKEIINKALAVFAIILGTINILSLKFEKLEIRMPNSFQKNIKSFISSLTSPIGAVFLAIFSLVFLTPCTIGPYLIATGLLSNFLIHEVIALLILYNFIFVLPLILILLIVYFGISKAEKILKKREKYEKIMQLITGSLLLIIGILLLLQFT